MTWLTKTPMCVVNAHVAMLNPLTAEESRSAASVVGVGHAMKPGDWARKQIAEWDKAARMGRGEPVRTGVPLGAGIKVIRHGRKAS